MALFKRTELKAKGASDELADFILTEANRKLAADYIPVSEVQEKIDQAVQAAKDKGTFDPTATAEYKAVAEERDMLRALGGEEFSAVKPKFREAVYKQLDRSEGAASVADQLTGIREKYEEYFETDTNPKTKPAETGPRFGAPVTGSMPDASKTENTFESVWFGTK